MILLTISIEVKSDWITYCQLGLSLISVIITLFGVLYVVKSFNAQKEINEEQRQINLDQKKLNQLAMEKDRREIRPYFKIDLNYQWQSETTTFNILLHNAIAFDVMIEYIRDGRYDVTQNILLQSEWVVGFGMMVKFGMNSIENNKTDAVGIVTMKFKDESQRAYQQIVHAVDSSIYISVPRIIEDYSIWQT
jgi:hypothetical protein